MIKRMRKIGTLLMLGLLCICADAVYAAGAHCRNDEKSAGADSAKREKCKRNRISGKRWGNVSWQQARRCFENMPEAEQHRLMLLMKKDPEAFHQAMQQCMGETIKKHQKELIALEKLVKAYHAEKKPAKKEELRKELHQLVADEYQKNLAEYGKMMEEMQARLKKLEQIYEKRKNNADKIIEHHVDLLLNQESEVNEIFNRLNKLNAPEKAAGRQNSGQSQPEKNPPAETKKK